MTPINLVKAIVATAALVSSSTLWAMGPWGGEGNLENRLGFLSWKLDLSEDQEVQIAAELEMAEQQIAADREQLNLLRTEMRSLQSNFDPLRAEELADAIGESTAALVLNLATSKAAIYQLLDADQQAQLDELIALREEKRGSRRGPQRTGLAPSDDE